MVLVAGSENFAGWQPLNRVATFWATTVCVYPTSLSVVLAKTRNEAFLVKKKVS